jgi:hypothetical protein
MASIKTEYLQDVMQMDSGECADVLCKMVLNDVAEKTLQCVPKKCIHTLFTSFL